MKIPACSRQVGEKQWLRNAAMQGTKLLARRCRSPRQDVSQVKWDPFNPKTSGGVEGVVTLTTLGWVP